jgi:hypothetical protein
MGVKISAGRIIIFGEVASWRDECLLALSSMSKDLQKNPAGISRAS